MELINALMDFATFLQSIYIALYSSSEMYSLSDAKDRVVTHSYADPLALLRKFLNSGLVRLLPSAMFNGMEDAALRI